MVKFGWDKLKRFLAQNNSWTGQQTFSNINVTGGTIAGVTFAESFTSATNPAANAAVSTAIVNTYNGVVVTLTGAGNSQTLQSPTTTTTIRKFIVINNDTSTHSLSVIANGVTFTVTPGEAQMFIWDGSAWGPIDMGITAIPVPVNQGGTNKSSWTQYSIPYASATTTIAEIAPAANAVMVTNASSVPSMSTTLPNSLALGTPTSGDLQNCTTATNATKGVSRFSTDVETATGTGTSTGLTPVNLKYRLDSTTENVVEDLSYLSPITFTWDPAELVDGAGETSSAVTVPGAVLGATAVQCIAPYDLQGITLNAYVDAAGTCKARLQNETGGTINLASGTWTMQARRI